MFTTVLDMAGGNAEENEFNILDQQTLIGPNLISYFSPAVIRVSERNKYS